MGLRDWIDAANENRRERREDRRDARLDRIEVRQEGRTGRTELRQDAEIATGGAAGVDWGALGQGIGAAGALGATALGGGNPLQALAGIAGVVGEDAGGGGGGGGGRDDTDDDDESPELTDDPIGWVMANPGKAFGLAVGAYVVKRVVIG